MADKLLAEGSLASFKKTILSSKAVGLNGLATFLHNQGNIAKALEYYSQSLMIYETLGDKNSMAILLNNIGSVYVDQNDLVKAAEYMDKSLKLQAQTDDKKTTAALALNLGYVYAQQGKNKDALQKYKFCADLLKEVDNKTVRAMLLNNTGLIYIKQNKSDSALDYFFKSLKIREDMNDKFGEASSLSSIANAYFYQKKYKLSRIYSDSSLAIAKRVGFPVVISFAERTLAFADSALGNYKEAFEHYKQYIIYRDSLNNQRTRKASIKNQLKYEFEKKEAVIKEQQEKERALAAGKDRFQKIIIASVIFGLFLVLVFATFIFRSLKVTRHQKKIIEEKQKEILDSIHYAKRIQRSLLPTEKYLDKIFKDRI